MSQGLGRAFDAAQRAYDARMPEEHDCAEDGHDWKKVRVARIDGVDLTEYQCRVCGERKVE